MRRETYDEVAVRVLLSPGGAKNRQAKLRALAKEARDRLEGKVECPECENKGPHDDNGCTGSNKSFCCQACGTHFDDVDGP